jgi:hypothetical protein
MSNISQPPRRLALTPLYRLSLPGLGSQIGTPGDLVAFGDAIARWLSKVHLTSGDVGVDGFLNWAAVALTCEELPARGW